MTKYCVLICVQTEFEGRHNERINLITNLPGNKIVEIGNQRTMRVSKQGGGIGAVRSEPASINCGTTCISSFDSGSQVRLIAEPDSGSTARFERGIGDADCSDGRITMNANRFCVAIFKVSVPPSSSSGSSSSN